MGFLRGFVVGALSLAGFCVGAFVGTRLGPELLRQGNASPYAPLLGLLGGLIVGGLFALGLEGLGLQVRARMRLPAARAVDGVLGAVLAAALALGIAWITAAALGQAPGARNIRADLQRSVILRRLNDVLPPTGPILNALARLDPLPQVRGPNAPVAAPPARIARDPDVARAGGSVVRVLGTACGLGISG